jgi:hypothetical protein
VIGLVAVTILRRREGTHIDGSSTRV